MLLDIKGLFINALDIDVNEDESIMDQLVDFFKNTMLTQMDKKKSFRKLKGNLSTKSEKM